MRSPSTATRVEPQLAATRESLRTAMKTQGNKLFFDFFFKLEKKKTNTVVAHISQEEGTQQAGPCEETPGGDSGREAEGTRRKHVPET